MPSRLEALTRTGLAFALVCIGGVASADAPPSPKRLDPCDALPNGALCHDHRGREGRCVIASGQCVIGPSDAAAAAPSVVTPPPGPSAPPASSPRTARSCAMGASTRGSTAWAFAAVALVVRAARARRR